MAKNWKVAEAAVGIQNGNKEVIADCGRRFPLFTNALAKGNYEGLISVMLAMPDYMSVRKIETALRGSVGNAVADDYEVPGYVALSETEETEEIEEEEVEEVKKPAKKAKKAKKAPVVEEEDEEDEEEEEEEVKPAKKAKKKPAKKAKKAKKVVEEEDEDEDDEDDDWDI